MTKAVKTREAVPIHRGEIEMLAGGMAACYDDKVRVYEERYGLTHGEAKREANEIAAEQWQAIHEKAPENVDLSDLQSLYTRDPLHALVKWSDLKQAAADELASGVRSAQLTKWESPWEQAQFLALRQSFIEEWQPRGGIEQSLIDQMAHCYNGWMLWLQDFERLRQREVDEREMDKEARLADWTKTYLAPRVDEAEYVERAQKIAERYHRMFMRSLRALRDLRRYAPRITIHNDGQVNIGQQQMNRVEADK